MALALLILSRRRGSVVPALRDVPAAVRAAPALSDVSAASQQTLEDMGLDDGFAPHQQIHAPPDVPQANILHPRR